MNNKPNYQYLVLGSGRQGAAAAYDLACYGDAGRIVMADQNLETAQTAAERVNKLSGTQTASAIQLEVTDPVALQQAFERIDVGLSAVPYKFNLAITRAAIAAGAHLCDMGGNTAVVWEQLALDKEAFQAGVSIVPDCGMGPGLINTMGAFAIDLLDEPEEIYIYDAGLPQDPQPPWNYQLTFHINGLTNEMDGKAMYIRDGQVVGVDTLTEPEFLDFPRLGRLEADVSSGGTSTAPWTFEGRVKRYENKVLRYPGHYEWLRAYKTLGLFSEEPIKVGEQTIVPRDVYHTLLEPKITAPVIRDICIVRTRGVGVKDGRRREVVIDLIDAYDEKTGFTGMERLTGWHCAIMMGFQARGQVKAGSIPMEIAVPPDLFMEEIRKRGIQFEVRWGDLEG